MARLKIDQLEIVVMAVDSSEGLDPVQHKNCYTFPSVPLIFGLLQRIEALEDLVKKLRVHHTKKHKRKKRED